MSEEPTPADKIPTHTQTQFEQLEKLARLLSLVAIPIVLAVVGWFIQNSLSDRSVSQEYVKLSVTILKEPRDKTDHLLRAWAADLLNQNSPTKFSPDVLRALKDGEASLPSTITSMFSNSAASGAMSITGDGTRLAIGGSNGAIRIFDIDTKRILLAFHAHNASVTAVSFSPDGNYILSASADKTARLWDSMTGKSVNVFNGHEDIVIGVIFSPDGRSFFTRSLDNTVRQWSLGGKELLVLQFVDH